MKSYRILLADDHNLVREGIRRVIENTPGLEVVGEAADGRTLLSMLDKIQPQMVLLDVNMPGMRGIEAAREIRARHPEIRILFLSMHRRRELICMAFAAGARGYLLKEDSSRELIEAIQEIRGGRTYLSRQLVVEYATGIIDTCRGSGSTDANPLTRREQEIVKLIAEGQTDREISEKLFISLRTAQRHRSNIRGKLKLRRTADITRYATSKHDIKPLR